MAKKFEDENRPTKDTVARFKMLSPMLSSLLDEVREFSKKKPDGVLNKFKVATLNRTLKDIKDILSSDPSNQYLDLLDEDSLPQNSDAVLVLGQFQAAMSHFKSKYYGNNGIHGYGWQTAKGFLPDTE